MGGSKASVDYVEGMGLGSGSISLRRSSIYGLGEGKKYIYKKVRGHEILWSGEHRDWEESGEMIAISRDMGLKMSVGRGIGEGERREKWEFWE